MEKNVYFSLFKKPFSTYILDVHSNQNNCTCPKWLSPNDALLEGEKEKEKEQNEKEKCENGSEKLV